MKRVLVTGGAGFIGSNLIRKLLLNGGWRVICFDNFDPFYSRRQKEINIRCFLDSSNFSLIEGDICDPEQLAALSEVDLIIHLAAKPGVRMSILHPALYLQVNMGGTQNLLEFARVRKIKQFLFASSSSVYGVNPRVPWNEEEKLLPISPYASSKLSAEMMGHVYSCLYGIRFIALRFFTVYGPAQRPDLAIYKFFDRIMENQPVPMFGDGFTFRDYTYVDDITDGIMAAAAYDGSEFEIINIGNNHTVILKDLVRAIESICQRKAFIERHPDQAGDIPVTYADITKAAQLLQYKPNTPLDVGLTHFFNWYKANKLLLTHNYFQV